MPIYFPDVLFRNFLVLENIFFIFCRELEYLRLPARFSPASDEIQNLEAADTRHKLLPFQNTAVSPLPGAAGSSTLEIPSLQEAASSITLGKIIYLFMIELLLFSSDTLNFK